MAPRDRERPENGKTPHPAGGETSFRELFGNLPAATVFREGGNLVLNVAAAALTGLPADTPIPLDEWFETLYGESATIVRGIYERDRAGGFPTVAEVPLRRPDGVERVVEFAGHRSDTLELWLLYDVTDRVAAEREVRSQHELIEAVIRASTEHAMISVDIDGVIRIFNRGAERLLGYRAQDVIGTQTAALFHDPAEVAERAVALGIEVGADPFHRTGPAGLHETREWTYVRADGSRVPVSLTVTAVHDADGAAIGYLSIATDITERRAADSVRAAAAAALERLATTDALTGIGNRVRAGEAIASALLGDGPVGVALLDVDRFKRVNDAHGHAAGDAVLVEVARRLAEARPADVVARWGGEEFCVLLRDATDEATLIAGAEQLRTAVGATPVVLDDGSRLEVRISVGAFLADPGTTLDAVVDAADRGLYAAKRRGRDQVRIARADDPPQDESGDSEVLRLAESLALATSIRAGAPDLHARQVATLSAAIAGALRLPGSTIEACRIGGWVHDIGKLAIPDTILGKPGALDAAEQQAMRTHPLVGDALVARIPGLELARPAVRSHHERWDGTGYPDGLSGTTIPIEARIVAAADVYSAIASDRVYSKGRDDVDAVAGIRAASGTHLDPAVADALVRVVESRRLAGYPATPSG
jgi:diguanylate cyclase (GGDEF)-like protein/PAS domain S-box-containing protein